MKHGTALVAGCLMVVLGLTCLTMAACIPEVVNSAFIASDLKPAGLVSWAAVGANWLELQFDEPVEAEAAWYSLTRQDDENGLEPLAIRGLRVDAERPYVLLIETGSSLSAGQSFVVRGQAADRAGNITSFSLPVWGYNERPAAVLINEILSVGSSTRPDAVEFYVRSAGNLAGICFLIGVKDDFDARYIFPACEVSAGELLVLHLKPQGLAVEIDEIEDVGASGGIDATPTARDFWYPGSVTLPGKNGALTVYSNPQGQMVEALIYSERTSESDSNYRGFGTAKLLRRVDQIVAAGMWLTAGSHARPEDAAWSGAVTSTRTLCRGSGSLDSDSAADWHIVQTRGSTIGSPNSDAVYSP